MSEHRGAPCMKVVEFSRYGGPDVLEVADASLPCPGPRDVRIKVVAAGVNPADYKWRKGMFSEMAPISFPHILGYDVAGIIDALGDQVAEFQLGQRVVAMLDPFNKGGYAEYAVADAGAVAKVPDMLDLDRAAALPTPGLTGTQLISEHVRPSPGQTVLITGAVGAVGRFAMHQALQSGARVIAAVREDQLDTALELGAAHAIVLGAKTSIAFDHVADTVGGEDVAALCCGLSATARIMTVATARISPDGLAATPTFVAVHADGAGLATTCQLVAEGVVAITPVQTMPLAQAAAAHRLLEAGSLRTKIVLHP